MEGTSEPPIPFGIYGDTGELFPGLDDAAVHNFAATAPRELEAQLRPYLELRNREAGAKRGVTGDIQDAGNLAETGWGVIFGPSADSRIQEALGLLLKHREDAVHWDEEAHFRKFGVRSKPLYQTFQGAMAPGKEESAKAWLWRDKKKLSLNPVNPGLGVPYYILIVAPPDEISFEFQYSLDLYWAVGRIWFENADGTPNPEEFRQYAASVVSYETMPDANVPTSRQMAVFAPCLPLDDATQLFSRQVAQTMVTGAEGVPRAGIRQEFALQPFIGPDATKDNLARIFGGGIKNGPPAILFSGGHGAWFRPNEANQNAALQGALVCQDRRPGPLKPDYMFAADDVQNLPAGGKMHGMIHFMFACYGGGWPASDTYRCRQGKPPEILGNRAMLSRLPQKLLSHPDGALAVIAHVDQSWGYSFRRGNTPQLQGFTDVIAKLMWGNRIGQATDEFNRRWAVLSTDLLTELDKSGGRMIAPDVIGNMWIARDDARNYIVIGDPAVRLRVEAMPVLHTVENPCP